MNTLNKSKIRHTRLSHACWVGKMALSAVASSARGILFADQLTVSNTAPSSDLVGSEIGVINEISVQGDDWLRLCPYGVFNGQVATAGKTNARVGDQIYQVVDREAADIMVTAFNSVAGRVQRLFSGTPYFEGHPDDPSWQREHPTVRAVAVGRIKELAARDDGLYGRVAWNDLGAPLVKGEAKAYDAHSPRFAMQETVWKGKKAYRPVRLLSMGLTNFPNIPGNVTGLNEAPPSEYSPEMKTQLIALLAALGKPPAADATDDQLVTAANEAVAQVTGLQTQLLTVTNELTQTKSALVTATNEAANKAAAIASERAARAELVLATAINEGRLTQASKGEWLTKLTSAEDFAATEQAIKALPTVLNTRPVVGAAGSRRSEAYVDGSRLTTINEAVKKHQSEHPGMDWTTAFSAVKTAQPALFAPGA